MGGLRYNNPAGLIVASVILEILTTLGVGLRFYSRRWKRQSILLSDWLILIAWIFGTGLTVLEIYGKIILHRHIMYPNGSPILACTALENLEQVAMLTQTRGRG